jgi:hypothetical protein
VLNHNFKMNALNNEIIQVKTAHKTKSMANFLGVDLFSCATLHNRIPLAFPK